MISTVPVGLNRGRLRPYLLVALLTLPLASAASAEELAVAEGPTGEEVARLCVAHGRYCDCPGCRAFYGTCEIPCPPGEAPLAAPSEGGAPVAPEGADAATEPAPDLDLSNALAGPTPSVSSNFGAVSQGLSSSPNMIGDSPTGGCGGLKIDGQIVAAINTPIYACSRLNIAENNSAMVRDRFYFSYRHFHNASLVDIFGDEEGGARSHFDINQYTLGGEKILGDWTSVETRLPLYSQLRSDLVFTEIDGDSNVQSAFDDAFSPQVGNLAVIVKHVLRQSRTMTVSTGVGVNIPTGPDFSLTAIIDDPNFPTPSGNTQADINALGTYHNETVNLQPFFAYQWRPGDLFFSNGFLQVDIPLNESPGEIDVTGTWNNNPIDEVHVSGTVPLQTLLRANLSGGIWLTSPPTRRNPFAAAIVGEFHYTGTLDDATTFEIPVNTDPNDPGDPSTEIATITIGSATAHTNVLNAVIGVPLMYGPWSLYNGFGVPLREGMDRGYDFEYSCIVQRAF